MQDADVFILDLEASIPFEDSAQPALRALNSSREQWERLRCPAGRKAVALALVRG